MGFFTANAPAQLHPVNPPLGVNPNYIAQQPTTLVLKERAFTFSGDDFQVKDQNGHTVVKCTGKAFSFKDRKVITDPNGRVLFHIRNKMIAIRKTYVGEDDNGNEIFRIKKSIGFGTKMQATFINHSTNQETTIDLRGDFWGGSGDLTVEGGPTVAQITRQLMNMRQVFTDNQTYFVTCAPGVDLSLMAAMCICFDEAKNENNNS